MTSMVKNWKRAWRWFSVQALVIAGLIPTAWLALPVEIKQDIPANWMGYITLFVALCGVLGRIVKQEPDS